MKIWEALSGPLMMYTAETAAAAARISEGIKRLLSGRNGTDLWDRVPELPAL